MDLLKYSNLNNNNKGLVMLDWLIVSSIVISYGSFIGLCIYLLQGVL
jgi:hypothetical protein